MKRFSFLVFLVMGSLACGSSSDPPTPPGQDATGDAPTSGEVVDTVSPDAPDAEAQGSDTKEECDCSDVVVDECHETSCFEGACVISVVTGPCDDGNACTENDFCLVGACVGSAIPGCCTADCAGKECGDDGCGDSCGTCEPGESCDGEGQCFESVALSDTCADAQVITELPFQGVGDTTGLANDYEAPAMSCTSSTQGQWTEDAVYSYTATFDGYLTLSIAGTNASVYVVRDCADIKYSCATQMNENGGFDGVNQAPVETGETYFIIVESDAGAGYTLNLSACYPDCAGKECGDDGCGHWCGFCESPEVLNHWECASNDTCICIPDCYDMCAAMTAAETLAVNAERAKIAPPKVASA